MQHRHSLSRTLRATTVTPTTPNRAARVRVARQIEKTKEQLAQDITEARKRLGITQAEAYRLTGQSQSQFSLIENGHLDGFSFERLFEIRALLGAAITVRVVDGSVAMVRAEAR